MIWITRKNVKVDRVACPWLIKRFVDREGEFRFVPAAIAEGVRHRGFEDDHEINAAQWIVYDALYAYCQEMVRRGRRKEAVQA